MATGDDNESRLIDALTLGLLHLYALEGRRSLFFVTTVPQMVRQIRCIARKGYF